MSFAEFARALITQAGDLALEAFKTPKEGLLKKDKSYVTKLDGKIEAFIRSEILKVYPDHTIFGEEQGLVEQDSGYIWYVDPLDGTTNFMYDIPIFGVMLSLYKKGEPILAAMMLPALDKLYWAEKGKGTFLNDQRLQPPSVTELATITFQMEPGHSKPAQTRAHEFYTRHALKFRSARRYGSYAGFMLGLGHQHPLVALHFHDGQVYEAATAALIFREAGYIVLNGQGKTWSIQEPNDLICVPPCVKEIMQVMLVPNGVSNGL